MPTVNPVLLDLARKRVWQDLGDTRTKQAVDPAAGGMPPAGMPPAGMPPGGAPPADPAAAGMPGVSPGASPGGMPGMAPGMGMPMDPSMGGGMPGMMPGMMGAGQQKLKPEQMMMMLDFRMYNLQMQLTAIMNAMNIQLPPGALVTPPGSPVPVAESAVPGGPQDPSQSPAGQPGQEQSAIQPIQPIQGAAPAPAGAEKAAVAVGSPYGELPSAADTSNAVDIIRQLITRQTKHAASHSQQPATPGTTGYANRRNG